MRPLKGVRDANAAPSAWARLSDAPTTPHTTLRFDFGFGRRVHSQAVWRKSAFGAPLMPSLNRPTALSAMLLLAAAGTAVPCPYVLAAQERGQEHETRTVEKEKPA